MLLNPHQAIAALRCALQHRFALLAVNADSPAALTDCLEAAHECDAPILIETSLWQLTGRSFGAGDPALGLARYLVQLAVLAESPRFRHLPVLFHTDHIKGAITLPLLKAAVEGLPTGIAGATTSPSTISLDSSQLSEADNIATIVELSRAAHACGRPIALEMEGGVDDGITPLPMAERLLGGVEKLTAGTVHLWAPGVGTQHGLGDQSGFSPQAVREHQQLATQVCGRPVGIALHGSSGLADASLQAAVAAGVVKVNWSSESLLLRSQAAQEYFATHTVQLLKSHPDWKNTAMDHGLQSFIAERYVGRVAARIRVLGGHGQAGVVREALS